MQKKFQLIPDLAKKPAILARNLIRSISYRGTGRWCPVCGKDSRKFGKFGIVPREDAVCMHCGAGERHRFVWLYFCRMTNLFDGKPKKMLHVAPELCFEFKLRKYLGQGYITADSTNRRDMVRMDITNIQYPDSYFDVIYCSHVLEHVQDDKKAIREFYRVLKQDGWAILLVPITADTTFEDSSIVDPSERLRVFGQEDHVRRYGTDYIERLREAGFKVKVSRVSDLFKPSDIVRMGLTPASGEIYYCYKT
jgi:SAM-dependent methyltransferase